MGAEPARVTVELRDVRVRFPRRERDAMVVDDLVLLRGERLLVLGPTGSGKSTLLRVLTGVVPHSVGASVTGEVAVCGLVTVDHPVVELSRHVSVMAQDPAAGVCLPLVEQELALPLENRAVEPGEISGRIDAALATVGAADLRSRRSSGLSGGETQRVALAASLVARPDVLLLDEPTSMLDGPGVAAVRHALAEVADQLGPTVVMVEHRLDELAGATGVAALPERALVLGDDGEAVALGPTADVLATEARRLHAAGCWLPLETELLALTGRAGGLDESANRELLAGLGHPLDHVGGEAAGSGPLGVPVLSARGLAVSREPATTTRRSRRGPGVVPVLSGVDLDLRAGEVVALLGANGSGKSTLLLALAGLLRPVAGTVEGARPGLVFQDPEHQLVAHTVADEIGHGLGADRDEVVGRQLGRHRLEQHAGQSPWRLSGGEKRRLSLAVMLAHDRPALLLDEPTLGLDRRDTIATASALRETAAEGRAVLFASHDLRTVATLADRVVVLAQGRVVVDGPVVEVLADRDVLARAGLVLPPLLAWLVDEVGSPAAVRNVLLALDEAVRAGSPTPAGTR